MEKNELTIYEGAQALCKPSGDGYKVTCPTTGATAKLERGTDFAVLPKMKQPTLLKSGGHKIIAAYGLLERHTLVNAIEDPKAPFFMYTDRCDLIKIAQDGTEYCLASAYGSCNTSEKSNGFASPFDQANACLKKAQKRSMVASAINVSCSSSLFSQDMENEEFMNQANDLAATLKEDAPITAKQLRRIWALAANVGLNANEAKNKIVAAGFASTKDIKQKDYEKVCKLFEENDGAEVHS